MDVGSVEELLVVQYSLWFVAENKPIICFNKRAAQPGMQSVYLLFLFEGVFLVVPISLPKLDRDFIWS